MFFRFRSDSLVPGSALYSGVSAAVRSQEILNITTKYKFTCVNEKFTSEEAEQRNKFQLNIKESTDLRIDTVKRIFEEEIKNHRDETRVIFS
jgi:hypothetical protein